MKTDTLSSSIFCKSYSFVKMSEKNNLQAEQQDDSKVSLEENHDASAGNSQNSDKSVFVEKTSDEFAKMDMSSDQRSSGNLTGKGTSLRTLSVKDAHEKFMSIIGKSLVQIEDALKTDHSTRNASLISSTGNHYCDSAVELYCIVTFVKFSFEYGASHPDRIRCWVQFSLRDALNTLYRENVVEEVKFSTFLNYEGTKEHVSSMIIDYDENLKLVADFIKCLPGSFIIGFHWEKLQTIVPYSSQVTLDDRENVIPEALSKVNQMFSESKGPWFSFQSRE